MATTGADLAGERPEIDLAEEGLSVEAKIWSICRMTVGLADRLEPREAPGLDDRERSMKFSSCCFSASTLGDRLEPREAPERAPVLSRCSMASTHLRQLDDTSEAREEPELDDTSEARMEGVREADG